MSDEKSEVLLDEKEVSAITGRAPATLQKDRVNGRGIPFVRIGRLVRYRKSDVTRYIAELPTFLSTAEADQREAG
ncbi:MAG: helix-turn-helix transcriptional regulator [Methylocystis sp.]